MARRPRRKTAASKRAATYDDPVKDEDLSETENVVTDGDTFEPEDPDDDSGELESFAQGEPTPTSELLELHENVEQALFAVEPPESGVFAAAEAFQGANAIVGIGSPEIDFDQIGPDGPGTAVLNIYVAEPMGMEEARACAVDGLGIRSLSSERMPINVINTGLIETLPHKHRERPAPNGISVGHKDITAGTQGALARGRSGDRRNRVLMLSNNHVLADVNEGRSGDSIIQPGPADAGRNPQDRVAILERFVQIHFDGRANFVDCATGWTWHRRVRKEYIYRSGGQWRHFGISNRPRACQVGMLVGKSGRTTQLTAGRITDCNASIRVDFRNGRLGNFRDQIAIRGLRGNFSAGGDSGSMIWTWDGQRSPVGLLFAGGGGVTFANKIHRVLAALDIDLL